MWVVAFLIANIAEIKFVTPFVFRGCNTPCHRQKENFSGVQCNVHLFQWIHGMESLFGWCVWASERPVPISFINISRSPSINLNKYRQAAINALKSLRSLNEKVNPSKQQTFQWFLPCTFLHFLQLIMRNMLSDELRDETVCFIDSIEFAKRNMTNCEDCPGLGLGIRIY